MNVRLAGRLVAGARSPRRLARCASGFATASLCAMLFWGPLHGQELHEYDYENLEFRSIGIEVAAVYPADVEATLGIGLRADLGYLGPAVRIVSGVRYWSSWMDDDEVSRLQRQIALIIAHPDVDEHDIPLGPIRRSSVAVELDGHYVFVPEARWEPYVGAGLGVRFVNGRGDAIEGTFVEEALTMMVPSFHLVAGVEASVADHLRVVAEARYGISTAVRDASIVLAGVWRLAAPIRPRMRPSPEN